MRDTIGKLWTQTCIAITAIQHLCILTLLTQKLHVVYRHCTYNMTALQLEMSVFCVRAGCEIRLVSYASKCSSQFLSDKSFVRTYMHNLKSVSPGSEGGQRVGILENALIFCSWLIVIKVVGCAP